MFLLCDYQIIGSICLNLVKLLTYGLYINRDNGVMQYDIVNEC